MKRTSQTDDEWAAELRARKKKAEREMLIADHKKGFVTLESVMRAANLWGVGEHTAEMRLMRGELPDKFTPTPKEQEG